MSSAIILGATGQDGTFLFSFLESKEYSVFGVGSKKVLSTEEKWSDIKSIDICDFQQVSGLIKRIQPDEIYHLAAVHQSSQDKVGDPRELLKESFEVNVLSLQNCLEAVRQFSSKTRIFYAASSHIFGHPGMEPQDENTPLNPIDIYGITKASGVSLCRMYRSLYGTFVSVGILYNHESWLRGNQFVSQKIVRGALDCRENSNHKLILGDLSGEVDWGFAPDYVDAMWKILALPEPDDFIISSGEKHKVQEFVSIAFDAVGLDWRNYVEERKGITTKNFFSLVGNSGKLVKKTGWKSSVSFAQMINLLINHSRG